ncbi:unnamed protein product [Protopolystoma xenopodis]|uniref:Uncharacterized protein n=1 Tax=Protopolystoma xenopodis TaxID=117903 RepID=A0A448X3P3_9PLAT|nr:unnamed protein product [Protopolystoma xenopodis]
MQTSWQFASPLCFPVKFFSKCANYAPFSQKRYYPTYVDDFFHAFRLLGTKKQAVDVDNILKKSAILIDFSRYVESSLISAFCPIKRVYMNQLAANNPLEDRWNVGLTQVLVPILLSCPFP